MKGRRLLALLCVAVLGVLLVLGLAVGTLTGPVGAGLYTVLALALVVGGAVRGRRLLSPPSAPSDGRTCTCCTTSQFDPVQVIE